MDSVKSYAVFIEKNLVEFTFPSTPLNLYDPLSYFLALGGKRMRPILTILSGELFEVPKEESIHAALCIELFHNFSLIHDDIMDEAPVRRGKETVHKKWSQNTAILSGDVLFVHAYKQLALYSDERLPRLLKCFNEAVVEVCEGQQMDMDFESAAEISEEKYLTMIRLKTSVLLGCALEMGAILGRKDEEIAKKLYNFGVKLGIAFQIQDDILDLYGNPETFGKQIGGDILAHKQTLLHIAARELCKQTNNPSFNQLLEIKDHAVKVAFAHELFQSCGALDAATEKMENYYSEAEQMLNELELQGYNIQLLREIAQNLMVRIS